MATVTDEGSSWEVDLPEALDLYFEYRDFWPNQERIIVSILKGENIPAILPTGSGKSLCYQLPACLFKGFTVVVSPLISLMKDQEDKLKTILGKRHKVVESITSLKSSEQREAIIRKVHNGRVDLLFVSPERLRDRFFLEAVYGSPRHVSLVTVDEAHCITEWGHDFRVDYLYIKDFVRKLGSPRVLALTATANQKVQEEICHHLNIPRGNTIQAPLRRDNLTLSVIQCVSEEERFEHLMRRLFAYGQSQSLPGIIYTATRGETAKIGAKNLSDRIRETQNRYGMPLRIAYYHGDMEIRERERIQRDFMDGKIDVLVATRAFGMGIDKENIRFIIHYNIPGSIDAYFQEIGRGGRDGKPCDCVLYFLEDDIETQEFFIEQGCPSKSEVQEIWKMLEFNQNRTIVPIDLKRYHRETNAIALTELEKVGVIQRLPEGYTSINVEYLVPWESVVSSIEGYEREIIEKEGQKERFELGPLWRRHKDKDIDLERAFITLHLRNRLRAKPQFGFIPFRKLKSPGAEDLEDIERNVNQRREYKHQQLERMVNYVTSDECRYRLILSYLGEESDERCKCDNCQRRFE